MLTTEAVQEFITQREFLPKEDFVKLFLDDGDRFIEQEDVNWDFKDRWPFSDSDDYFFGIARLIGAFANTCGGFIIFGVHDLSRTPGHNKVTPNTDKLRQSINACMGRCPEFEVHHYDFEDRGGVDVLLVMPRKMGDVASKHRSFWRESELSDATAQ